MGKYYAISPINEDTLPLLMAMGLSCTDDVSRYPTINEIRAALDELGECLYESDDIQEGQKWDATITCDDEETHISKTRMTILCVAPLPSPQEFYFVDGCHDLILKIVSKIANRCGALVILSDGMNAFIVPPNSDPEILCDLWIGAKKSSG